MANPEGKRKKAIGKYKLTCLKYGGKWYFSCPLFPDIASKHNGEADNEACCQEFELRAVQAVADDKSKRKGKGKPKAMQPSLFDGLDHDGATFDREQDGARLNAQTQKVFDFMQDGSWRTLAMITAATGAPEASASARLRDLKKPQFGGRTVERRRVEGQIGLWEYRLLAPDAATAEDAA